MTVGASDAELRRRLADAASEGGDAGGGEPLSVRLSGEAGELVGGLVGWVGDGWGGIEALWIDARLRGRGWGARVLGAAESALRGRGCADVVVTAPHAAGFFTRHGYTPPVRAAGWCLHKRLGGVAPRLRLVAVVDAPAGAEETVRGYEDRVLALLGRHGGRLEERLCSADGRTEVQTISFGDRAGFEAFLADPVRAGYRCEIGDLAPDARVIWLP